MIEKCLIEHCAPTLASLKAANLFNACCEEGENIAWKQGGFFIFRSFRKPGKDNLHEYCNHRRK